MAKALSSTASDFIHDMSESFSQSNWINPKAYARSDIKRGLRNSDGTGVLIGVTQIGNVYGYYMQNGEKVPMPGRLVYRGINVEDLIRGFTSEGRFGYEETAFLLLMGHLPTREELNGFNQVLDEMRPLPPMFTEDQILRAPSNNLMNKLARSILTLYSYDPDPETMTLENELRLSMQLIAQTPMIVAHGYAAKRCYIDGGSLYLHGAMSGCGTAENFLAASRDDRVFSDEEAKLLDLCLVLHAEHGGGNNSTFSTRVISSSYTDIFSAIAAGVGSLKGPRHGGANIRCQQMVDVVADNVKDWRDDNEIKSVLVRILNKELGDGSGLIYGMGHAVYTLSDPRAKLLKRFARSLAEKTGMGDRLNLIESIERLTPEVFRAVTGSEKYMCANVDLYSGFVYSVLNIPVDLFTPLFATARIVGWCAHRIEEIYVNPGRIMRPAYKAVAPNLPFVPLDDR